MAEARAQKKRQKEEEEEEEEDDYDYGYDHDDDDDDDDALDLVRIGQFRSAESRHITREGAQQHSLYMHINTKYTRYVRSYESYSVVKPHMVPNRRKKNDEKNGTRKRKGCPGFETST